MKRNRSNKVSRNEFIDLHIAKCAKNLNNGKPVIGTAKALKIKLEAMGFELVPNIVAKESSNVR